MIIYCVLASKLVLRIVWYVMLKKNHLINAYAAVGSHGPLRGGGLIIIAKNNYRKTLMF